MTSRAQPKLDEVCEDAAEILAMSVSRFIAAAYMTGDAACWDAAYGCAESVLGPVHGPRIVGVMAGVMRALKVERLEPWTFMPASCCRITSDEANLLEALQAARRGSAADVGTIASQLARSDGAARLGAAVNVAAEVIDSLAPAIGVPAVTEAPARIH